jgi:RimJ/RimL family protein N-acetyltransferase
MEIYLREAVKEDIGDIYKYINREYVKKYSSREKEEWFRHKAWYRDIIFSTKYKLLIINDERFRFMGLIKYEIDNNKKSAMVSIFIPIDLRNKGIGKKALKKSFTYLSKDIDKVYAEVLTENEVSLNFFVSFGFEAKSRDEFNIILMKKLNYDL